MTEKSPFVCKFLGLAIVPPYGHVDKNVPGLRFVRNVPKKGSQERDTGKYGQTRLKRVRALKSAKDAIYARGQLTTTAYTMLVVTRMSIAVVIVVKVEGQPVTFRNVIVAYDPVRGNVGLLDFITGAPPKNVQGAIVLRCIGTIDKGCIAYVSRLDGDREQVRIVPKLGTTYVFGIGKPDAFRNGFSYFQILDCHGLVLEGIMDSRKAVKQVLLAFFLVLLLF